VKLLRKPSGHHGKVHDIAPADAGWGYVGFGLFRLRAGERAAEVTGAREVILVLVEGHAHLTTSGQVCMFRMEATGRRWRRLIAHWRCVQRREWAGMPHNGWGQRVFR
jgi:5-deoxy-D-glucuronate isomerase